MSLADRIKYFRDHPTPELIAAQKKWRREWVMLFAKLIGGFLCAEVFVFLFIWWLFRR